MRDVSRAFGLACRDMFNPWIFWLSIRPFIIAGLIWFFILWFTWNPILDFTKMLITESTLTSWINDVMSSVGWSGMRAIVSPYLAGLIIMPLIIITLLVIVSFTSMTAVVKHIEKQTSYQGLRKARGGGFFGSLFNTLVISLIALFFMIITFPLWWIPPLFSIIPPIIWGWLTAKLMSYDILAIHANKEERMRIFSEKRMSLLLMGVIAGLLGAVPTFFWLSSIFILILFPIVSLFMMWIYTLIFIFAALWFGHFLLLALRVDRQLRGESL